MLDFSEEKVWACWITDFIDEDLGECVADAGICACYHCCWHDDVGSSLELLRVEIRFRLLEEYSDISIQNAEVSRRSLLLHT
jgi:hypothetical protein